MCKGLAVITTKINNEWIVYTKQHESSHDKLLHELDDGLRYGTTPHLKFEVIFPHQIKDDIIQDVNYPEGWTEMQFGKKIACIDARHAVSQYLNSHQELLQFNTKMLQNADLQYADLRGADLRGADLRGANLLNADLRSADLLYADLRYANLLNANLRYADLLYADLRYANLLNANLRYANLRYANLRGANLLNADLRGAGLQYANLEDANLEGANLQDANLLDADLQDADLRKARYNLNTNIKDEHKNTMVLVEI